MDKEQYIKEVVPLRKTLIDYARGYIGGEEAEDVVQDALMKIYCIRDTVEKNKNVKAFSYEVVKHLCIDLLRKEKIKPVDLETVSDLSDGHTPDKDLIDKENILNVKKMINRLPSLQQTILRMRNVEGLEVEEIARLTGGNEVSIRTNLSRARKKVKELFFEEDKMKTMK